MALMLHALAPIVGRLDFVIVGQMLLTLVLCGLVGIERSTRERASGFRPHILVGLGACLMTLAGGYGFANLANSHPDPMRIASYVVSGIGFLGAGAILRHGTTVRGLTTAATLWGAAGIGIAVGVGLGGVATVATLLFLFTLSPLKRLEARIRFGETPNTLRIHLSDDQRAVSKTMGALDRLGVPVKRATILPAAGSSALLQVELNRTLGRDQMPLLVQRLLSLKQVTRVDTTTLGEDPVESRAERDEPEEMVREETVVLNLQDVTLLQDLDDPSLANLRN
jgi:putative Mg2+ transporter-C (MgtC) family protein